MLELQDVPNKPTERFSWRRTDVYKRQVEQVVAEYGLERTKYVLAAAIQTRDGDGRISRTNRKWADSIRTIKDMDRRGFDRSCYYADLQAHTCLCLLYTSLPMKPPIWTTCRQHRAKSLQPTWPPSKS